MKKALLLLTLIITSISVSFAINISPQKRMSIEEEVFLRAQMEMTGIRSARNYSILGIIDNSQKNIILQFKCEGDFCITITKDGNNLHTQYETISTKNRMYVVIIPASSFENGTYTMRIENMATGFNASGKFTVE